MKNNTGNIYLIGMMGSGKSVTGRALASLREATFIDLDTEIERKEGRTISDIFAQSGEPFFRDTEAAVLASFARKKGHIFATGGGIILRSENVRLMKETGTVIFLDASVKTLWQRLQYSKGRPLLNKPDPFGTLTQIYNDREPLYKEACHVAVATDGKTAEEVAEDIQKVIKSTR